MIKANELRLGNAFKQPNDDKIYFVQALREDQVAYAKSDLPDLDYWYFNIEHIEPIPLTPEILEKCGAKPFPTGDLTLNNHLITYAECRGVFIHAATSVELKHLHQLQNLYFALTGEELNVTL